MAEADLDVHATPSPLAIDSLLRSRVAEAIIAQGGIRHEQLNAFLRQRLASRDIGKGALFSEPAVEGAAGYVSSGKTPANLVDTLLHPKLVAALSGKPGDDYRFEYAAYEHQLRAWSELAQSDARSVLVSSGTGSGKTECFLVPLLNDLAKEADQCGRLTGVRALMLYPLNALIASQEERLRRWTAPFMGAIRFGLYNGLMQDKRKHDRDRDEAQRPEQVLYRHTLRSDPPPILVTNNTMLEYMTVRKEDHPIVEASRGLLRWIVIDEAHSYMGSAAAEVALLLRRVLQTFDVKAENVRFVATSATIGGSDDKAKAELQKYLADLAGVPLKQVRVVFGKRETVALPAAGIGGSLRGVEEKQTLGAHPAVQQFVRAAEEAPVALSQVATFAKDTDLPPTQFLEAIAQPRADGLGQSPILPLRVHKFIRAVPGLWSCISPDCRGDRPVDWPYGSILFERNQHCTHCDSLVYEVVSCRECGEPWLNAFQHGHRLLPGSIPPDRDEFAAASARELDSDEGGADSEQGTASGSPPAAGRRLIATRQIQNISELGVEPATGVMPERRGEGAKIWLSGSADDGACPRCFSGPSATMSGPLLPWRFGAPFLVQNATLTMLEGVSPTQHTNAELPAEGRQLLSFTDSRQGTARFAANIETMAERGYVRSFVYHLAQKATAPATLAPEQRNELREKRDKLAALAATDPMFEQYLSEAERELAGNSSDSSVRWTVAVGDLANEPTVKRWISQVWDADRDARFKSSEVLANFLLLRELARRPRRANAIETLGFAKLVFPVVEKVSAAQMPQAFIQRCMGVDDWRDFLYFLIDSVVRGNFALNVSWDDARWMLPRHAFPRAIVGPNQDKRNLSDIAWPQAKAAAGKTNAVLLLERALLLDTASSEDRAVINDILQRAWDQLHPMLEGTGSTYALRLEKISIGAVGTAWLCPVTNRVLPRRTLGRTPNGLRGQPLGANETPVELQFPSLPIQFPRTAVDQSTLENFIATNEQIAFLRARGVWSALHDRAAMFAPYVRAEEHSAQQPPHRLRAFEEQFKRGEINLLACSTTMEMGVDIGSIESVLNTNVPPSIANYRQRVGRAGRRGQSFASSLTYARDTPLDREAFRQPIRYLGLKLRSPQVKLDSGRIVQRHCNALLLADWLKEAAGQLTRIKAGDFFGYPQLITAEPDAASPAHQFCAWLLDPSTAVKMLPKIEALTRGTALAGNSGTFGTCETMVREARDDFGEQWRALREQAQDLATDAKRGIEIQVRRMCREPLLGELTQRSILPGHGFPTAVVPFINDCAETRDRQRQGADDSGETTRNRRYDYPTRNADVAIREYAPGAEIVVDGLVWTSAGVTLNWERPAHDEDAKEIQSLRWSWQCLDCGEAGCAHIRAGQCSACGSEKVESLQFLEPAGFRVDWTSKPHADTDQVVYVEPQPARVSARKARWEPLLDPALGRARATGDGMVFHYSCGQKKDGYRICLDCGRAAEEGIASLAGHDALMPRKGSSGHCPGNEKQYAVTQPLALGYEVLTDVAELQPAGLSDLGAAWALASALREALARQLGIEPRELGLAVESRAAMLGAQTHSVFVYDQSAGGAGYTPRLLDDLGGILKVAQGILQCPEQCERGCSSCVLVADLYAQQEIVDRKAALAFVEQLLAAMAEPASNDAIGEQSRLSPPVADALARKLANGAIAMLWIHEDLDLAALGQPPFSPLFALAATKGAEVRLVFAPELLEKLDDAMRAGLRNASHRYGFSVWRGLCEPAANSAKLLASTQTGSEAIAFYSRDENAALVGADWGVGSTHPIIVTPGATEPPVNRVPDEFFERAADPGDRVILINSDPGRVAGLFGKVLVSRILKPELEAAGLWKPGQLESLSYSDRYVKAPLPSLLLLRAAAALRDALDAKNDAVTVSITTERLRTDYNRRAPYRLWDNWDDEADRTDTIQALADRFRLACTVNYGSAAHGRKLVIRYKDGSQAILLFDQGFGYWSASGSTQHNFRASPAQQAKLLEQTSALVAGTGESYIALTRG